MSLGKNGQAIRKYIDGIESEARALIKEVSTISVWSGTSAEHVWFMTYQEREVFTEVIKEKLDLLYGKKGVARGGYSL